MRLARASCRFAAFAVVVVSGLSDTTCRAGDAPEGAWPGRIPMYRDAVDDIPLPNTRGVKAIRLTLDLRRWETDKQTGAVKSISGGLTHQQVFDDSFTGQVLYQLDDGKTRYPLPELTIEGMEAKAGEQFSLLVKNTKTTTIRANKAVPDELILTIVNSNADVTARDVPISRVKFRPRVKR